MFDTFTVPIYHFGHQNRIDIDSNCVYLFTFLWKQNFQKIFTLFDSQILIQLIGKDNNLIQTICIYSNKNYSFTVHPKKVYYLIIQVLDKYHLSSIFSMSDTHCLLLVNEHFIPTFLQYPST